MKNHPLFFIHCKKTPEMYLYTAFNRFIITINTNKDNKNNSVTMVCIKINDRHRKLLNARLQALVFSLKKLYK